MVPWKSITGNGAVVKRKYAIGATVVAEQVVCQDTTGVVGPPAGVNDYSEAAGVTLESGTYAATQAGGNVAVSIAYAPLHIFKGVCSGGATAGTALAAALDGNLLTNSTASAAGTVVSDTNVGTSEFVSGYMVGLTGANQGRYRRITAHSDNTSETVTEAFTDDLAANDTFLRVWAPLYTDGTVANNPGELTTNFVQFNIKHAAGEDIGSANCSGDMFVEGVFVDDQELVSPDSVVSVLYPTAPTVELSFVFMDHTFNQIA